MAIGTVEIALVLGTALVLFGAPAVVKWAKALREAKHELNKSAETAA